MYIFETKQGIAKCWLPIEEIEASAIEQIVNMISHPRLYKWAAIMPDVHAGIGATVGSVIPMDNAVIPSAVGVDIGCGMCSVKTSIHYVDILGKLPEIHSQILQRIPRGFAHRTESQKKDVHAYASKTIIDSLREYGNVDRSAPSLFCQLGTLGGGNHFIELQKDSNGLVYIMIHSGSRNIGNRLATNHIRAAKKLTEEIGREAPKDLDYFDTNSEEGKSYIKDMTFALNFAKENRFVMMEVVKDILSKVVNCNFEETINIHHNYAAKETHFGKDIWVHRKGATKVTPEITGIIPGSMGEFSFLVNGTGNADSFNSCSHGAGRTMSRKKAKENLDLDIFVKQMEGIYSESVDIHHLDEAPDAYKNIGEVMANQTELVTVKTTLEPILNVKG